MEKFESCRKMGIIIKAKIMESGAKGKACMRTMIRENSHFYYFTNLTVLVNEYHFHLKS